MTNRILRRPRRDDAPRVAALMNASASALIGRPAITLPLLEYDWLALDLQSNVWLIEDSVGDSVGDSAGDSVGDSVDDSVDNGGRIVGYLKLYETDGQRAGEPSKNYRIWGCVDRDQPDSDDLRKLLLTAAEAQAAQQGIPVEIDYRVNAQDEAMVRVLLAGDYAPTRTFWQMRRRLADLPEAPSISPGAANVTIRAARTEADQRAIYALHMDSFRDHWNFTPYPYETWLQSLTAYPPTRDPSCWLIAEAGDALVGFVIGVPGQIIVPEMGYEPDVGYVAYMGTRQSWRGRGVAKALLYAVFDVFRQRGMREVSLGVDAGNATGATHLYQKVGMARSMTFDIYRKIIDGK